MLNISSIVCILILNYIAVVTHYNSGIKQKIVSEICSVPNCTYKKSKVHMKCDKIILSNLCIISAAVQRKYESMWRQWKAEDRDDFIEASRKSSLMKKFDVKE